MPLKKGHSEKVIQQNIREMVRSGYNQSQAVAAALHTARKARENRNRGRGWGMFRPLHDWIVVREVDPAILESERMVVQHDWYGLSHKMILGRVLAVGPGRYAGKHVRENRQAVFQKDGQRHPPCVKIGDVVGFDRKRRELDRRPSDDGAESLLWVREKDIDWVLNESGG